MGTGIEEPRVSAGVAGARKRHLPTASSAECGATKPPESNHSRSSLDKGASDRPEWFGLYPLEVVKPRDIALWAVAKVRAWQTTDGYIGMPGRAVRCTQQLVVSDALAAG